MAIRVTCPKCHTRFNVSDKFAGKEGPCPKCKSKIRIPDKTEEVVITAPSASGPKDSQGRAILKPIKRRETILSTVQLVLIAASIIGFLAVSFLMRTMIPERAEFPILLLGLSSLIIAFPLVYVGYAFLRNQELDFYVGQELWGRVGICSVIYAMTWIAMPIAYFAFDNHYEVGSYVIAGVIMLGVGGVAGMYCFDLDYFMGSVHYGLYLGVCLLGRWLAGIEWLPIDLEGTTTTTTTTTAGMDLVPVHLIDCLNCCLAWLI